MASFLNTDDASLERRPPVGVLTDGEFWRIYFLQTYSEVALAANDKLWDGGGELYISSKIVTNIERGRESCWVISPICWYLN